MNQCIDLTGPKSVARVTLGTMSATGKEAVEAAIGKTLKGQINKAVKATILDVAHQVQLAELNCRHLTKSVDKAETMVHRLKPSLYELLGMNQTLSLTLTLTPTLTPPPTLILTLTLYLPLTTSRLVVFL